MRGVIVALLLVTTAACSPSEKQAEAPQTPAPAADERPPVDPAATAALDRMGAYLRTLTDFEVRAQTTTDMVLDDTEQKVQFAGDGLYRIHRPNAFYLESNTDRRQRRFYYNGETFTIYSPRQNVYAQRPAPATIREMVDQMQERYDIPVPLSDLFYWGLEPVGDLELASHIGFARMNGQEADHYAFRQGDLDWQIWIARGDQPLPLKVVITTRSDPAQPQYTSELAWNLNPRFDPSTFAFRPPDGAHEIHIVEARAETNTETN
jgi:hypothetical protein